MKAHIARNQNAGVPLALGWNLSPADRGKLEGMAPAFGMKLLPVAPADAGKTVAQLLGEVEVKAPRTLVLEPGAYPPALVLANFRDKDVDTLLEVLAKEQPQLHLLSAAGEQALQKKAAEKAARKLPELSEDAQHSLTVLRRAKDYLDAKPELSAELSAAQRRKRAQLQSKPVYRYVALAIFVLGVAAAAYGLYSVFSHTGSYGVYFALFGFAAIFLFSSYNMLPTAHNNNNAIMKRAEKAEAAMAEYVKHYPHGAFPVASWYAHPIVLKRMMDAIEEGNAVTVPEALDAVKARLKSLNADVQVEQEEYDEVVVIKALFLNHDYQ